MVDGGWWMVDSELWTVDSGYWTVDGGPQTPAELINPDQACTLHSARCTLA